MTDELLPDSGALADAVAREIPRALADLRDLVRIPSISADGFDQTQVRRSADATAALFAAEGVDVQVLEVAGSRPAVIGRKPAAPGAASGAPTVLLYAHHDVQPVGNLADWSSDPFEPVERDGRLHGRGTSDDKSGIASHLAVLRAFGDALPVDVVVLIEGEEEIGSPTLPAFLAAQRDALAADVIVLADSGGWKLGRPALTTSLRGLVDCVVEVRTARHAVHSGMYGGAVPDALTVLCRLLATLHTDTGEVAVEGLHTGEADPLDLTEEQLLAEVGAVDGLQTIGSGPLTARMWARPAVSVLALDAPRVAEVANVLVPSARAVVSLRTAPGQDGAAAMAALTAHLRSHVPWGAQVTVTEGETGEAFAVTHRGPAYDAARPAFERAWGVAPLEIGIGGSIPFIAAFAETFPRAEILVTGSADPDSRAHGPDESLHLEEFARYTHAEAELLARLGARTR
jgi:acetylornithine deacetylase/succinyl-diaminopimelate desuccinylase-like protein